MPSTPRVTWIRLTSPYRRIIRMVVLHAFYYVTVQKNEFVSAYRAQFRGKEFSCGVNKRNGT